MRRRYLVLAAVLILCGGIVMYVALTGESGDRVQALYSRIQKEYDIELTDSVIASVEYEPYYSRDYACVAAMKLTEEYAQTLGETVQNDASWIRTRKSKGLIDEYIEPCLSSFEKLADLKQCCTEEDSYMKLIIHDEHAKEFSVLVLNAPKAELFYFTLH